MGMFKVWSSSADDCTCSLCAKLDGTAVNIDEVFEIAGCSVMDPPLHDGCRCTVSWVDESFLEHRLVRAYKSFVKFSNAASTSRVFQQFVACFFAAEYFLEQLASASCVDLASARLAWLKMILRCSCRISGLVVISCLILPLSVPMITRRERLCSSKRIMVERTGWRCGSRESWLRRPCLL